MSVPSSHVPPELREQVQSAAATRKKLLDPGRMDDFNKEVQEILRLDVHDGFSFELNKPISQNAEESFSASHSVLLGASSIIPAPSSMYTFGTQLVTQKGNNVVFARVDPSQGSATTQWIRNWSSKLKTRGMLKLAPTGHDGHLDINANNLVLDGNNMTLRVNFDNFQWPSFTMGYVQAITESVAIGTEFNWVRSPQRMSMVNYGIRYNAKNDIASVVFAPFNSLVSCSYRHKVSPQLSLASELQFSYASMESMAVAGAQYSFRESQFRGQIDSSFRISGVYEVIINPVAKLTVCGEMDQMSGNARFGFGVQIH